MPSRRVFTLRSKEATTMDVARVVEVLRKRRRASFTSSCMQQREKSPAPIVTACSEEIQLMTSPRVWVKVTSRFPWSSR